MRIINLIENTEGSSGCLAAHGLSFYVETKKHRLLVDLGPSEDTLRNAEKLGIDLTEVDTVILSHGHYDHSGGILAFSGINPQAVIYMQKAAAGDYYSVEGADDCHYIGIDKKINELPQVKAVEGDFVIDDELALFTVKNRSHAIPQANRRLKRKTADGYVQDEFLHEQNLVIREDGHSVLISGCAHNGILNILEEYRKLYGGEPDAVISGFHMMKKSQYTDEEILEIMRTANALKKYKTVFYTCHCTGIPAYSVMKNIMGKQLNYVHSGDEVKVVFKEDNKKNGSKKGSAFMKCHKFFAWAAVICFLMTMITGYKKK